MMSISVAGPCPRFLLLPFSRARDRTYSLLVISSDGTWMNLETIILSKLTQEQKMKYCMFSLIENHQFPTFEWLIYKGFYMSAGIRMAKIRGAHLCESR
ncbi:uncharacterized protein LOC144576679 isoform X2 [Callithrix jacchus]